MSKKSKNPDVSSDIIRQAREKLWRKGNLEWKFSATQKKINDYFRNNKNKVLALSCTRRGGKTYLLTVYAVQVCLSGANKVVKFVLPEQKMARSIMKPIMREILEDCPEDLRPKYSSIDSKYVFPNGSEIQLAGSDAGNADRLRGTNADLCLVDEAGFCNELDYIVRSILTPLTLLTGGKIILSSTVPPNPNHPFIDYMNHAAEKDALMIKTIFDFRDDDLTSQNPRITDHLINEIIASYPGGIESPAFQNEYMCRLVYNNDEIVVPEFTQELQQDIIIEWQKPSFCLKYVAMDIGFTDLTVVLFAYYDFDNGIVVIEDEITMAGPSMTTDKLAERIKNKEKDLWSNPYTGEVETPYKRVSDNNLIVINDLYRLHSVHFLATQKDNKEMAINNLRMMLANNEIIINPRCKVLIHHIKNTVWNKARTDFRRTSDGSHGDALMAAVYLIRNLDKGMNPYPKGYHTRNRLGNNEYYGEDDSEDTKGINGFKKLFQVKKVNTR
jgi:hypothetical protein